MRSYIAYNAKDGIVWGVGKTPKLAIADAVRSNKEICEEDRLSDAEILKLKTVICSELFYKDVKENGWCDQTWHIFNGVAKTIEEALGETSGKRIKIEK